MSAIFGIVRHDGAPVSQRALGAMQAAMGYRGPDGAATWLGDGVGLGHLLLRTTPEAETRPCRCTASGRIDDHGRRPVGQPRRAVRCLRTPNPQRRDIPDGRLILESLPKMGPELRRRLLGDWSFALWDAGDDGLFLARD